MPTATKPRPKAKPTKATEVKSKPAAKATRTAVKTAPASKPTSKPAGRTTKASTTTASTPSKGTVTARKRTSTAKATPAPDTTAAAAVKAAEGVQKASNGRVLDLHGFAPGSDSSLIAKAMIVGGVDRGDVNAKAADMVKATNGLATRQGGEKSVPSLSSGILKRLKEKGYTVESTWRLVPPADIAAAVKKEAQSEARKAAAAARKAAAAK